MPRSDTVFAGSMPDVYDDYMVPLLFETYARDMAARVAAFAPSAVLETAAGSGVVSRALAPLLARDARYVVTDLNQPMLDRAALRQPTDNRIRMVRADAMALPFEDGEFDLVCCQFGAMFFPDRPAAYAEARRVLRDGGRLVVSVWDRLAENEFAECVNATAARLFPDDPPDFFARIPHGYHDPAQIEADLRAGGFASVAIETVTEVSRADSPRVPALALCQGTPLRSMIEARDASRLNEVTDRAAGDIAARFGTGPVAGRMQAFVAVAAR